MSESNSSPKPVIVMTPHAATPALREAAEKAGYAVLVTSRPAEVHILDVMPFGDVQAVAAAAYRAILDGDWTVKRKFGGNVAKAMLAAADIAERTDG